MADKEPELTYTEKAHLWQDFRMKCVDLAIQSKAEPHNVISLAKEIAEYIMTKDARETAVSSGEEKPE